MSDLSRNHAIVVLLIILAAFVGARYSIYVARVEAHNSRIQIEADRKALQARRDREHAFREKCRGLDGTVPLRCSDLCVRGTEIMAVAP